MDALYLCQAAPDFTDQCLKACGFSDVVPESCLIQLGIVREINKVLIPRITA